MGKADRIAIVAVLLGSMAVSAAPAQTVADKLLENHRWYLPETGEMLPTVVAVPGCSGVSLDSPRTDQGRPGHDDDVLFRRHYPAMAERLRDAGFAVLLLDLLGAEGVINACGGEIPAATISQYISAAIDLAKGRPRVDPAEISVLGWSMGGGGVIAWLGDASVDSTAARRAVAVYPACGGRSAVLAQVPLLMLLGSADDITEPGECEELVERSPSRSLVTVKVFEGARHGFDIEDAPEVLEIGGGMTVGHQEDAARGAWLEILAFLETHGSEERPSAR